MKQNAATVDGQVEVKGDEVDTVIIGAGQCGLSTGYYLAKQSKSFVILDENERVGDNWRRRYDSLRLYTPRRYNGLPGMAFPGSRNAFPTGHEMADYLQKYAATFDLPVRGSTSAVCVERLTSAGGGFLVTTNTGTLRASNVVVATGPQHLPHVPDCAGELEPEIRQFHSNDYRNQSQLQPGPVLVVGASHSGADLAMECAPNHPTWLVGRDTGQIPIKIEGKPARGLLPVLWFVANHVLTVRNPAGSSWSTHAPHGRRALASLQERGPGRSPCPPHRVPPRRRTRWAARAGRRHGARCHERLVVHGVPERLQLDRPADLGRPGVAPG